MLHYAEHFVVLTENLHLLGHIYKRALSPQLVAQTRQCERHQLLGPASCWGQPAAGASNRDQNKPTQGRRWLSGRTTTARVKAGHSGCDANTAPTHRLWSALAHTVCVWPTSTIWVTYWPLWASKEGKRPPLGAKYTDQSLIADSVPKKSKKNACNGFYK